MGIEYKLLQILGKARAIEWKMIGQEMFQHNSRTIDMIKIESKKVSDIEVITQVENYYFDITDCIESEASS
ncbi:MAG TPA: hypothetical protein VMZ03_04465 [Chitinophagaceae bacterium]|nr:hypothetical protein [Chitinophagaceae bacterium]